MLRGGLPHGRHPSDLRTRHCSLSWKHFLWKTGCLHSAIRQRHGKHSAANLHKLGQQNGQLGGMFIELS
jgi:hypothetical protein